MPYAGGGKGRPRPLQPRRETSSPRVLIRCTGMPNVWRICLRAEMSWQLNRSFFIRKADALRGRRQGATAPLATPARDFVPTSPDSMHWYAKRLAHMLTGRNELATESQLLHSKGRCPTRAAARGDRAPCNPG